jgi:hypothetical protein
MSRVKAVVGRSIKVSLYDVKPGDILYTFGDERDPIIAGVERAGALVRLVYKYREGTSGFGWSLLMDPTQKSSGYIFIYDLYNERADFEGKS